MLSKVITYFYYCYFISYWNQMGTYTMKMDSDVHISFTGPI